MTDSSDPDLSALTIKDLRLLAIEHNIPNRSRLGKDELIQHLQEIFDSRKDQPRQAAAAEGVAMRAMAHGAASSSASSSHEDADDDENQPERTEDAAESAETVAVTPDAGRGAAGQDTIEDHLDEDEDSDAEDDERADEADEEAEAVDSEVDETLRPSLAGASASEPEEITAESVAILTRPPVRADGAPNRDRQDRDQDGEEGPLPGEGDPGRRRRRRRRRRGRGRDGNPGSDQDQGGQRQDAEGDFQDEGLEEQDDAAETVSTVPVDRDVPSEREQRPRPPQQPPRHEQNRDRRQGQGGEQRFDQRSDRPDQRSDQRSDRPDQRSDQRSDRPDPRSDRPDQRPSQGQRPGSQPQPHGHPQQAQRPQRPRLEGPLRPVPSVLDRLCTFSKGILELCGPDTPSWAQPRLSELLAESGMVMVPVLGPPHPDFHEVIGTMSEAQVPAGHIAQMVAPGFALRGDRGDLFPLRKAKVRIAVGLTPPPGPGPGAGPDHGPDQGPGDEPHEQDEDPTLGAPPEGAMPDSEPEQLDAGTPGTQADPAQEPMPEDRQDAQVRGEARRDRPMREQHGHAHSGRSNGSQPAPARQGPRELQPREQQPRGERRDPAPPAAGRPPLRTHPRESAEQAPRLPLTSQHPDELAARPKAEGFRGLGLNDQILADLAAIGYQAPTPIQLEAIPSVLAGKDLVGQAQTGTGKTAAFVLPILQALYALDTEGPVALVLCPTRELARQVHAEFVRMAGASGARAALIYGGVPMDDQTRARERQPHVVIGTPGRIIDHMRRHTLDLSRLRVAVLDEADQMLDIGFWPDVQFIISHSPPARQMLLFSATFPEPIKIMAEKHMKQPVHVRITPKQVTVAEVDQKYIAVKRERKNELLAHFIETEKPEQLVVFCKTKHQTDRVAEVLKRKHMSAAAIHGDLPQSRRERTLAAFRAGELQCLIATNVAARGLDIPTVSHVLNYDIPEAPEEYVHRIGRTARNGARGVARTFITADDGQFLVEIEKHIGLLLEEERIEGFAIPHEESEVKRSIADMPVGTPRLLKPLVGGIRLGRRR